MTGQTRQQAAVGALRRAVVLSLALAAAGSALTVLAVRAQSPTTNHGAGTQQLIAWGKYIFRFDTFGDERLWTDQLRMHEVVQGVDPTTALAVGLKVDSNLVPPQVLASADLTDPATTAALLKLNAVVGLRASVDGTGRITRLGVTCALCHSTVDNSVMPGVGRRMDGWPNRDLDVGAIIALSPAMTPAQRAVYTRWGPGKYDPRLNIDGRSTPVVLPPAYGLAHVKNETYTGDAPISYWNAYVAVTQMGGQGRFVDPRLGINITRTPDLVTSRLPALRAYQLSLPTPAPPVHGYDPVAAQRGRIVFNHDCIGCHTGVRLTDNNGGNKLHAAAETGMDPAYAMRSITKAYRTTPLRGLWQHPPYFHDGSARTLADVVDHYDRVRQLELSTQQKHDLVEFLKTL